jgi:hypothetical protein
LDHGPDIAVLENRASVIISVLNSNVDHRSRQVVGANHLVGKYQPKHRVDRASTNTGAPRLGFRKPRYPSHVTSSPCGVIQRVRIDLNKLLDNGALRQIVEKR